MYRSDSTFRLKGNVVMVPFCLSLEPGPFSYFFVDREFYFSKILSVSGSRDMPGVLIYSRVEEQLGLFSVPGAMILSMYK